MAIRLQSETNQLSDQIQLAFQRILLRDASEKERERLSKYVREMTSYHQGVRPSPVQYPTRITRSLVEEFSGQLFEYEEILPVFENYQADAKPQEVAPRVRALADLVLLLLNTNEFMYVE